MSKKSTFNETLLQAHMRTPSRKYHDETVKDGRDTDQAGTDDNVVNIEERVVHIEDREAATGDPIADYVSIWMALEVFHEECRLTEEGWVFLCEQLQRPLELRLIERQPLSNEGAVRALNMATFIMENMPESDPWYQRLRLHLVRSARDYLKSNEFKTTRTQVAGAADVQEG